MIQPRSFRPAACLRNGMLQTILASAKFRASGPNAMRSASRDVVLTTSGGVRLLAARSLHGDLEPAGRVVMLHGWEGSVDSTYMLCTGRALYRQGFDVVRINFRDHGNSHHLNPGIFYAVLLDEVFEAVRLTAAEATGRPVFLVGFSLGGNFVLRILKKCREDPIDGLAHAVAVSPVLDPAKSTERVDRHPVIRRYFIKKWFASLRRKEALFPLAWDFGEVYRKRSVRNITETMLRRYSDFDSAADYFRAYSLMDRSLTDIRVPTTILTAADDPIIPIEDFYRLKTNATVHLADQRFGGHSGFVDGWALHSWYDQRIAALFREACDTCGAKG
jgi:predicted alpha/beta-fold hydrolase